MFLSEAPRYLMYFMSFFLLDRIGKTAVYQQGANAETLEALEGSDIILPCSTSTKKDMVRGRFDWKKNDSVEVFFYDAGVHHNNGREGQDKRFRGRVSHFQDQLKVGNASIVIRNTTVEDSGSYRCSFPSFQPPEKKIIMLVVNGAAKEPYVTILEQTKDWALLQCEVRGASPKPNVTWQDSAGNILPAEEPQITERGNRYDVILNTTVTKTDHYRCVATQEEINHQTYSETHIRMDVSGSSTGWIAFGVVTIIFCLVLGVVLYIVPVKKDRIKLQPNKAGSQEPTSLNLDSVQAQQPLKG